MENSQAASSIPKPRQQLSPEAVPFVAPASTSGQQPASVRGRGRGRGSRGDAQPIPDAAQGPAGGERAGRGAAGGGRRGGRGGAQPRADGPTVHGPTPDVAEQPPTSAGAQPEPGSGPGGGRGRGRGRGGRGGRGAGADLSAAGGPGAGLAEQPSSSPAPSSTSAPPGTPAALEGARAQKKAKPAARATQAAAGKDGLPARPPTGWWRRLPEDDCDPITLDPLRELANPPFELTAESGVTYRFDGKVLAEYLVASKAFIHPMTRRELTREECVSLDDYVRRYRLGKQLRVAQGFDEAQAQAAAAAQRGEADRAALAARRAADADAILSAFYQSHRRGGSADRRGLGSGPSGAGGAGFGHRAQPQPVYRQPEVIMIEGNLVVLDDDEGMFRGDSRQTAQQAVRSRGSANNMATDHFPALPDLGSRGGPLTRGSWGGGGAQGSGGESWPALGPTVPGQEAPFGGLRAVQARFASLDPAPSQQGAAGGGGWGAAARAPGDLPKGPRLGPASFPSLIASSSSAQQGRPGPGAGAGSGPPAWSGDGDAVPAGSGAADKESDAAALRRKQLAEAFGVNDPEHRPSMFASASAAVFSGDVIKLARQDPAFVRQLEAALDQALASRKLRMVHELAKAYGITTQAYGNEPNRRVDLFVPPSAAFPSIRLSDAANAAEGSAAAAAVIDPAVKAQLTLLFTDIAPTVQIREVLWDFEGRYALQWDKRKREGACVFEDEKAFKAARERLGGGVRGKFRVQTLDTQGAPAKQEEPSDPSAEAEAASALASAAWDDDGAVRAPPGPAAKRGRKVGALQSADFDDWEEMADSAAFTGRPRVLAPAPAAVARNTFSALMSDDEGEGEEKPAAGTATETEEEEQNDEKSGGVGEEVKDKRGEGNGACADEGPDMRGPAEEEKADEVTLDPPADTSGTAAAPAAGADDAPSRSSPSPATTTPPLPAYGGGEGASDEAEQDGGVEAAASRGPEDEAGGAADVTPLPPPQPVVAVVVDEDSSQQQQQAGPDFRGD